MLILRCKTSWLLSNTRDMRSMSFRFTMCSCQMADFVHQVFVSSQINPVEISR